MSDVSGGSGSPPGALRRLLLGESIKIVRAQLELHFIVRNCSADSSLIVSKQPDVVLAIV